MTIKQSIYHSSAGEFNYDLYENITQEDIPVFRNLFTTLQQREDRYLRSESKTATKWAEQKVKLWGMYKSNPDLFDVVVANNYDHPFQFYSIKLKSFVPLPR